MKTFPQELADDVPEHLKQAQEYAKQLLARKHALNNDMSVQELQEQIAIVEKISEHLTIASCLSDAAFSVDQENEKKSALADEVSAVASKIYQQTVYFSLQLQKHPNLDEYIREVPTHKAYLTSLKENAKYSLPEDIEKIISAKDETGSSRLIKIYEMITGSYSFEIEQDGQTREVTRAELAKMMMDEDREVRKKARESFYKRLEPDKHVLNEIYSALIKNRVDEREMRGYQHPIDARHQNNEITSEVYQALKNSTQKHRQLFIDYLEHKRTLLGYQEMHEYDINANITGLPKGLAYQEAKKHMIDVFGDYAEWMAQTAQIMHASNRVDAKSRKNKRSGACCYEMPGKEIPLLILNHQDDYNSLKTLAHETGHAIHNILASENSVLEQMPTIVIAETASNLAEILIFENTRKHADTQEEIALLCDFLADALASIPQQLLYTQYEEWVYQHPQSTLTERCEHWSELQTQVLPNVKREPTKNFGWISIPHLYELPFYCYGYSFGLLLALSLYKQATPEDIKKILRAGGSKKPQELLAEYGYDITDAAFWDEGFAQLQVLVDRLGNII